MYSVSVCSLCSPSSAMNRTGRLGNSFCELSLSRFYANIDEDYDTEICLFVELKPLSCKCGLEHVAFHSIILFENSAILWLFARLAYVNVDKAVRNYVCSEKRNSHVHVLVENCGLSRSNCKICKSTCSHTIISRKTLFVTKSNILTGIRVINFPLVNFI